MQSSYGSGIFVACLHPVRASAQSKASELNDDSQNWQGRTTLEECAVALHEVAMMLIYGAGEDRAVGAPRIIQDLCANERETPSRRIACDGLG